MKRNIGFTLVELVIVVLILGILATIATPKLIDHSHAAADNGSRQTLQALRDAIDLFAITNGGDWPGADGTEESFKKDLAPYLRGPFPKCRVGPAQNAMVTVTSSPKPLIGSALPKTGWLYSNSTGQLIVNYNGRTASDPTVSYDSF